MTKVVESINKRKEKKEERKQAREKERKRVRGGEVSDQLTHLGQVEAVGFFVNLPPVKFTCSCDQMHSGIRREIESRISLHGGCRGRGKKVSGSKGKKKKRKKKRQQKTEKSQFPVL